MILMPARTSPAGVVSVAMCSLASRHPASRRGAPWPTPAGCRPGRRTSMVRRPPDRRPAVQADWSSPLLHHVAAEGGVGVGVVDGLFHGEVGVARLPVVGVVVVVVVLAARLVHDDAGALGQ